MKHVFIIGSRGLPAKYGGFETFVEKLTEHQISSQIQYHVACLSDDEAFHHFDYKGVDCFTVKPPKLGPARVIAYDMMAVSYALKFAKKVLLSFPLLVVSIRQAVNSLSILTGWSGSGPSGLSQSKPISSILRRS